MTASAFTLVGRNLKSVDKIALACFAIASLYALGAHTENTILLGVAVVLVVLGLYPRQRGLAFLAGAIAILFVQQPRRHVLHAYEGFTDASGGAVVDASGGEAPVAAAPATEGFSETKVMLPDNATRMEPLELGKPYKLPSEADDKGYHLDAGTTFLNAYKMLKPDQIAAMTKDTQDLLATQRSLVTMLDSFAPLMRDMGKITGMLNVPVPGQ